MFETYAVSDVNDIAHDAADSSSELGVVAPSSIAAMSDLNNLSDRSWFLFPARPLIDDEPESAERAQWGAYDHHKETKGLTYKTTHIPNRRDNLK